MRSEFMPSSITISYVMILPKCNTKSHLKLNVLECDNANSLSSLKTRQTISTRDEASSSSSSLSVLFRLENTLQNSASSHLQYNCSFPRMSYSQAHFFFITRWANLYSILQLYCGDLTYPGHIPFWIHSCLSPILVTSQRIYSALLFNL